MTLRRLSCALVAIAAVAGTIVALPAGAARAASAATTPSAAPTTPSSPAEQLADRYSPIVMVRTQAAPCDSTGEPYLPMSVDKVLGNPSVALRQVGNGDPVIKWAPTAKDLYGLGDGVYLDFPGDALKPGCTYAQDSARYTSAATSVVYAHVATQADRPGYLAVQYWLYWYYNDWNDKHESDWEFVQVLFKASSVEEALATRPVSAGYAQHEGGVVTDWASDALEKDGEHPVVYSSERSHASYTEPALFLGRGAAEGFGCDDTQSPSTRVTPSVVLLPQAPAGPDDPYAWLAFQGRWGERHGSPNNGPTGPESKPRWTEPVTWQEGLRASSFVIPGGGEGTPEIVRAFCTVVGGGSVLFIDLVSSPQKVLGLLLAIAVVLIFLLRRTSWRLVDPLPVVRRRRAGEITRAAVLLYRRNPLRFAALGTLAIPVEAAAILLSVVADHLPLVGTAASVTEVGAGSRLLVSGAIATAFWPITIVLVSGAVSWMLMGAPSGLTSTRGAMLATRRRLTALASSLVPAAVVVGLLSITVVGAPFAVWLTVRQQYLAQVTVVEGLSGWRAIRRSSALVRHRWLHTAVLTTLVWVAVIGSAVLVGLLLLVTATSLPLWAVSLGAAVVQVAITPLGAIVVALLYGDARAQRDGDTRAAPAGDPSSPPAGEIAAPAPAR